MSDTEHDINPDRGPRFPCKNGSCDYLKPKTVVYDSERKTLYRCPGCSRALHVDWKEDGGDYHE